MQVEINESSDSIFNYDVADNVSRFLASDPNNRSAAIADFVFRESVKKYQDAKRSHASSVRHSPLVIRLGALIYSKMKGGGDLYKLVAKVMGLPSDRQIRRYKSSSVNARDGFLTANVEAAKQLFDQQNPLLNKKDARRHVSLAYGEMSVKGRFSVNYHTNELVGIADDAFEVSVIERAFSALATNLDGDDDSDDDIIVPEPTKYFLAFIASIFLLQDMESRKLSTRS